MKSSILVIAIFLFPLLGTSQSILSIEDDRQLFLDDYILSKLDNVDITLHHPHNEGPVLYFDKEWEGNFSTYSTIIKDGGIYKAYYRGLRDAGKDGSLQETTCIALSTDGVHWTKPELGLFEIDGSKQNNVVLANDEWVTHNFSPFLDSNPHSLPSERYKAIGGHTRKGGLYIYVSEDGFQWQRKYENAVITEGLFDSQNVAFWSESEELYVSYFRTSRGGFRSVSRATSKDLQHWTDPVAMQFGDTPLEHLYTQQTSPYFRAPQIYVAIGGRFMPKRQVLTDEQAEKLNVNPKYFKDCSDAVIMTTRGGDQYDRSFLTSFIRPGLGLGNWVSRSNYPALNVVQTSDTEMSVYVNESYAQPTSHLKRYSMRLDGFASLQSDYEGGTVVTKPFIFDGSELEINYSTSAAGFVTIELQDEKGKAIAGYSLADCQEIIGNEISRAVTWNGSNDVSTLAGKTIQMVIEMKDANVYSFSFKK